jgi:hypothetical protein
LAGSEERNGGSIETASKLGFGMIGSANVVKGTRRKIAAIIRTCVAPLLISPPESGIPFERRFRISIGKEYRQDKSK